MALVAALLALLVWKVATDDPSEIPAAVAKGDAPAAPEFELRRLDEPGTLSLSSLRGKAVVINFWASWCEPCKQEAPLLEAAWRKYRDQGLVVVGIDTKDVDDDALRFARENDITYPLVHDGPGELFETYGLMALPETFFVDRKGRLVGEHIIGEINSDEDKARFEASIRAALNS